MDKWGRKGGVIYCASLSIFGGALECASHNIGMFIASRFFAGGGSWGFLALGKPHLPLCAITSNYQHLCIQQSSRLQSYEDSSSV